MNIVVGLGTANVGSLGSALAFLGAEFRISTDPAELASAGRLILPGVGAFDAGMGELGTLGLVEPIRQAVLDRGAPILGVCLGMQLLLEGSDEGVGVGLGLVPGRAVRLGDGGAKVPHVGFDAVRFAGGSILGTDLPDPAHFYFTHSFCLRRGGDDALVGRCAYDGGFAATIEAARVMGVQFHPEKSQAAGLRVLRNFLTGTVAAT